MTDAGSWLTSVLVAVGVPAAIVRHHRTLAREMEANDRAPAPEDHQVRWHIRHIRQDIALVAYLLMAILGVLVWIGSRSPGA